MAQVSYGTITITDTNDINRIYVEYCRSTSNQLSGTTVPDITVNWSESTPAWVDGQYIWQRTVVEKSGTLTKTYGTPVCLTGAQGETGDQGPQGPQGGTGAAGRSLTLTTTQYTTAATSATITQSNMGSYTWSGNVPAYNVNTPAYWVRITNVYSNPSSTEYIIYKDNGITDAVKTSHDANDTAAAAEDAANTANENANTAKNTASSANTKAEQAVTNVTNLQNKLKYYWVNEVAHTNGVNGWTKPNYPAGTYAASGISGTTFDSENSSTYGYNTWYANGINLRYNAIKLGELTGSALTFYQPSTTTQGAKAMELSGTALKFYASNGTTVQAEFGGDLAKVSGQLIAQSGYIGTNESNRWFIGNRLNYDQTSSAALVSYGTAYIQLGEDGCWRLSTNRLHTGWNAASGSNVLHYPKWNNIYWDFGIHVPSQNANKFIYIRNYDSTNSGLTEAQILQDLQNNFESNVSVLDSWQYRFYVTADGNLYARNLYVLDDNGQATQIGGTDGVYLLKSGGTITGDLTVNGTITGTLSGTATRVSKDLKIQLNGGTTENTNQFTYNGSTAKTINITKSSVGLSNVENTALSTWAGSANLTTTKVGTLAAAAVKGVDTSITSTSTSTNLPTSAAVATLVRGYLPLTGGNVTGAVTFGSSVSVDELTAGDLVVNGNASFTNNAQFNTINGVAVGSSPKFTDTVTTVSVTGSGNAVTSASATNGAVTLTKGTTFLTSHQTVTNKAATLAWNSLVTVATIGGTDITVKLPSNPDTNTTYTIGTGDSNGQIKVTPSSGNAYNVDVKGWTSWLPLAGGTMTGGITFNKVNNAISYTGSQATYAMIKFKDNTNDTYGNGIVIGGGGLTVIGGGESADTIAAQYSSGGDESMLIGSDGGVIVMTNVQDGYANRKTFSFGTDGTFNAPTNITINGVSVLTSHQDISGKADKSTTVTNVAYSSKKITKTINGTTSDVVTAATLKTDMALNNVTNNAQVKGLSSGTTSGHLVTWGSDGYTVADSGITKGNIVKSVGSNNSGQLVLTYADDTTSNPIDVTFVATIASSATLADALNVNGTAVGSATVPVYFDSQGKPQTANTIPKLNNATTGGTFYAPTTAGTTSQVLIGGGSNPTWKNISDLAPSSATNATNATYATYDASEASNTTKTTIANKYIPKSLGTAAGDIIYWSGNGTPTRLAKGSNGQVLKLANGVPTWGTDNNDNTWRGIQNNLTSDSTTDSLSAAQGKALASGSARDNTKLPLAGGTMTGQIKTSFKSSIATGSYQSSQTTVPNLCGELRYSSGVMGSANITTAYTKDGITVATGWYNFLWVPHRSGGVNGEASGDNCDYGSLYLSGMTLSGLYMIRYSSGNISEIKNLYKPPAAGVVDNVAWSGITSNPISFNSGAYGTTGWKQLNGRESNISSIKIWKPTDVVAWGTIAHSAAIAYGTGDTKGMIDISYNTPVVSIAGGNAGGSTDETPKWYFKFSATSGATYTLPAASKTLAATDGSNASGTWGISISGNAATATSATSATTATTATTADKLTGFSSRSTSYSWGNQTGTGLTRIDTPAGGSIIFRDNNPASGQTSMLIDGTIYIKEGNTNVGDAIKSITRDGTTFTYTTLWGNTGTFTQQDSDTKNTAGSTNTDSALFLIGATSQAANPQTYSHDTVKINTTGQIISTGYEMTTSSSMSNAKCQMRYEDSLQAIVFSFT